jgi:hypothetical protein
MCDLEVNVKKHRASMRPVCRRLGLEIPEYLDFATCIRLYTLEDPCIFKLVNATIAKFEAWRPDSDRSDAQFAQAGAKDTGLHEVLPFIVYLDRSLAALPARFLFKGRCHRGVKRVFGGAGQPHCPEAAFPDGSSYVSLRFLSTSRKLELMYADRFCGKTGARTIFAMEAVHGYCIDKFSVYGPSEAEVLFRPLTKWCVKASVKQCDPLGIHDAAGGFPDNVIVGQCSAAQSYDYDYDLRVARAEREKEEQEARARQQLALRRQQRQQGEEEGQRQFVLRVANNYNPFVKSNSKRLKSAAHSAAASMGTSVRQYDDSDTSVSGVTGFCARILLCASVNKGAFLEMLERECQGEGMRWGTNSHDDICPDEEGWQNVAHSLVSRVQRSQQHPP